MSQVKRLTAKGHLPPPSKIQEWFTAALGTDDPRPSQSACDQLARQFQIIANRHNNEIVENEWINKGNAELPVSPIEGMGDVSPVEWGQKKLDNVTLVADRVLSELTDLRKSLAAVEDYYGDYQWNDALSVSEFREAIIDFLPWLFGVGASRNTVLDRTQTRRGRPKSSWHEAGRKMGVLVQEALRNVGYDKKLSLKNESSAAVVIGTAAINWAFELQIDPSGFASAMRSRIRKQAPE